VSPNGVFGGLFTNQYPVPCSRCSGTNFHICRDGDDYVSFCANDKCLNEDSEASKSIASLEYTKKKERNEYGQIMTGAEKFRMGSTYKHACLAKWMASTSAHNTVLAWMHDQKPFLIVLGNTGTGKTFLSAAVLNLLFDKNEEIFYTTHRRFIEEIQRAIGENKSQHSIIDKLSYKKYLILDDLGAATCSEWQQEMILELIDRRYSNKLKTLITSNLNKENLHDMLGERTFSRLFDQNNSRLEFWGEDKRQNSEFRE
jgi:DNA replication protein DnaC